MSDGALITLKQFFSQGYLPKHLMRNVYRDLASDKLPGYRQGKQWVVDPEEMVVAWRDLYRNGRGGYEHKKDQAQRDAVDGGLSGDSYQKWREIDEESSPPLPNEIRSKGLLRRDAPEVSGRSKKTNYNDTYATRSNPRFSRSSLRKKKYQLQAQRKPALRVLAGGVGANSHDN